MLPESKPKSYVPLRASERRQRQQLILRKQFRFRSAILLVIIIAIWLLELTVLKTDLRYTKGVALGALLNWTAQSLFAWFVFRYNAANAKQSVVNQLYLGQLVKWAVTLIGFSVTFMTIQSISVGAVIIGFLLMQIGHFISLWFLK